MLVDWSTKEIPLEGLFTSQMTLDGNGDCIGQGGKFGKKGSDFKFTILDEVKWAKIGKDNKHIFVESTDVSDAGSHFLRLEVGLAEFTDAEPLIVKVPITIDILKGNSKLIIAYTLLPVIGILFLVAGFFVGCQW